MLAMLFGNAILAAFLIIGIVIMVATTIATWKNITRK